MSNVELAYTERNFSRLSTRATMPLDVMRVLPALAVVVAAACGAHNPAAPERFPPFVESLIRQLSAEPAANPPASITRYDYRGQVVYYVPPRCCDIPGDLYLPDGTRLCQPVGGFGGRGDGRCPDFFSERRNEQIVWQDPRKPS